MTGKRAIDPMRLAESAVEAAVVLGLTALPVAWHVLDPSLTAILTAMLALLTSSVYALHAVTFDCFRMTGHRSKRSFSLTQSKD
jgi:ABC-type microcin C transport system permease subunit YejE